MCTLTDRKRNYRKTKISQLASVMPLLACCHPSLGIVVGHLFSGFSARYVRSTDKKLSYLARYRHSRSKFRSLMSRSWHSQHLPMSCRNLLRVWELIFCRHVALVTPLLLTSETFFIQNVYGRNVFQRSSPLAGTNPCMRYTHTTQYVSGIGRGFSVHV